MSRSKNSKTRLSNRSVAIDTIAEESAKENSNFKWQLIYEGTPSDSTNHKVIGSQSREHLVRRVQNRLMLVDLPHEILADILGIFVDCDRKIFALEESDIHGSSSTCRALQLSSVCRRFRSVLLDIAGAWAVVTPKQPGLAFLTMCAKRSMDKGLRLFLGPYMDSPVVKLVRNLVVDRSACKIHSISTRLEFSPFRSGTRGGCHKDELVQRLAKLNVSNLKALNISYRKQFKFDSTNEQAGVPRNDVDGQDEDGSGNDNIHELSPSDRKASYELQSLLRSPSLQSASFVNAIPLARLMRHITKLSINLIASRLSDVDRWDVRDLINLLHSQPALEDFALEFYESLTFKFDNIAASGERLGLPSPNLKMFDLHWHASTGRYSSFSHSSNDIPRLFQLLDLKNLATFRFKVSPEQEMDHLAEADYETPLFLQDHLHFFLSSRGGYFHRLESFHLELYSRELNEVQLPISYMQNIRHLSLQFNTGLSLSEFVGMPDDIPGGLPRLQTVTIRNCHTFAAETVQGIVEAIKNGGNWESFQLLLVDQCQNLSWSSLEGVVGLEKLEVYPNIPDTRIFGADYDD